MADSCILGVKNEGRIVAIEDAISEMKTSIGQIRDKLLGRPSWVVLFLFTGMSSLLVAVTSTLIYVVSVR